MKSASGRFLKSRMFFFKIKSIKIFFTKYQGGTPIIQNIYNCVRESMTCPKSSILAILCSNKINLKKCNHLSLSLLFFTSLLSKTLLFLFLHNAQNIVKGTIFTKSLFLHNPFQVQTSSLTEPPWSNWYSIVRKSYSKGYKQ